MIIQLILKLIAIPAFYHNLATRVGNDYKKSYCRISSICEVRKEMVSSAKVTLLVTLSKLLILSFITISMVREDHSAND